MVGDEIIPASELVLNPDGSVYHLAIKPENLAGNIILVGDPGRVSMVSDGFDDIEFRGRNREFTVHTGTYRSRRITVMSTGMGTDNMDIVLNELDALVNIDLEKRRLKKEHHALNIFRLGTSGSLQPDIPLNAVVVSSYGLGLDGMLWYYSFEETDVSRKIRQAFTDHTGWAGQLPRPYVSEASQTLLKSLEDRGVYSGITATAPGFYGPQGRRLRLQPAFPALNDRLQSFSFENLRILNYEMETSALYGLSNMLGHQAVTVCLAIANRHKQEMNKDYHPAMRDLVHWLLTRIAELKD